MDFNIYSDIRTLCIKDKVRMKGANEYGRIVEQRFAWP
jgi:hypothetical protein